MHIIKFIRAWLARRRRPPPIQEQDLDAAAQRDIGVSVTRIRLPSGAEVVVVKKHGRGD